MKMMLTILMILVSIEGIFALKSTCGSCLVPEVPAAFEAAKAVFVGEVIEVIEPKSQDESASLAERFYVVRFHVEKSWKGGTFNSYIEVLSDQGRSEFGFPKVKKGERYLVYADTVAAKSVEAEPFLIMSACSRTAKLPLVQQKSQQSRSAEEFNREDGSLDLKKLDATIVMPPRRRA